MVRLVKIVDHHVKIVVRTDDFDPFFARDAAKRFVRNFAPGGLRLVVPQRFQFAERVAHLLLVIQEFAHRVQLNAQFFDH